MRAGELNKKIIIQDLVKTDDGAGGYSERFVDVSEAWAAIEPVSGQKKFVGMQLQSEITHQVTIRFIEDISFKMRVKFGTRLFMIRSIINPKESNERLQLFCEEVADV